jgi:hypothetical protein
MPRRKDRAASIAAFDQRTVVVSDDLRVAVVSPVGDTVVPLELDLFESVTTPLTEDECCVLLEDEESDGIGAIGVVVDCVVVELEDELCAKAVPAISVTAIVAASKVLIILGSPRKLGASGIARSSPWSCGACHPLTTGSENTQPNRSF